MSTPIAVLGFTGTERGHYGSGELATHLAETFPGDVTAELINETVAAVDRRVTEVIDRGYGRVIGLGTDKFSGAITIETRAANRYSGLWELGERPIIKGGPLVLRATLPWERVIDELDIHEIPIEESSYGGRYLCNRILYQGLWRAKERGEDQKVGFWHIPPTSENAYRQVVWEAAELAIETLLNSSSREAAEATI